MAHVAVHEDNERNSRSAVETRCYECVNINGLKNIFIVNFCGTSFDLYPEIDEFTVIILHALSGIYRN